MNFSLFDCVYQCLNTNGELGKLWHPFWQRKPELRPMHTRFHPWSLPLLADLDSGGRLY